MSEQLPPLVSHESLRIISAAAKVGNVSTDVLSFLSASAEYHLLDVVNEASNFRARGKRSRLTVDDVDASLDLRGAEGMLVFSGSYGGGRLKEDGTREAGGTVASADSKVDLRKVANASLPVCPIEPGFDMHWLAVDGQQPLLPQNPIPSSARAGKSKGGKRARSSGKHINAVAISGLGGADGKGGPVQARLSEELTTYLRRCCEAVLSRDEKKRERALASLRSDPGLQQLLPHLCTFIQIKVTEHLKKEKDPDQLAVLLQMLQCLLNNTHFAFLEIYLDRLLPPVMSCLLHRDFERRDKAPGESFSKSWTAGRKRSGGGGTMSVVPVPKWDHWKVRDYAGELLHAICDKHGHTYPTLQARASDMFSTQVARPTTPLTTLYGAIRGLVSLGALTVEQTILPRMHMLVVRISRTWKEAIAGRNSSLLADANSCLAVLIQAAGLSTLAGCETLFGKARTIGPPPLLALHLSTSAARRGVSGKATNNGEEAAVVPSQHNNSHHDKGTGGSGSVSGSRSRPRRMIASHEQARVRRRLDKSRYQSRVSKPERLEKIKAAEAKRRTRAKPGEPPVVPFKYDQQDEDEVYGQQAGVLSLGNGSNHNALSTKVESMRVAGERGGGAGGRGGVLVSGGPGGKGREAEWGLMELDEVVVPWYILGLRKEQQGMAEAQWLLDMHQGVV